ncbi:MAG TPA: hypothetical protein VMU02_01910 [bacterium]|nr:hypothetical protein [bacterium]
MSSQSGTGSADRGRWLNAPGAGRIVTMACYASVALLFTALHFRLSAPWSAADYARFAGPPSQWPVEETTFKLRLLTPLLARALTVAFGANAEWVFKSLAWASVLLLLAFYRRYLSNFLAPKFSNLFALALVYPLVWNFCLLNSLYFPFDIPSILFFVMGLHFIYRRNWFAYYPTLVLAALNRETSVFLIFVFGVTLYDSMTHRSLVWHLVAQAAIWAGLKAMIFLTVSGNSAVLTKSHLGTNLRVLGDMVALRGNFIRDWGKLVLAFGGTWLVLPWLGRRQPAYLRRCLLVIIPFIVLALFKGVIDEVRLYGELVPVVFTPIVYSIAQGLGGARLQDDAAGSGG